MNVAQDRNRLPQMKASDADRDAVVAALSEHFQAGRLTSEELEERTGHALSARTLGELDEMTADLPALRTADPTPVARPRGPGCPGRVPLVAVLAGLAVVVAVLGASAGRHGWDIWWVVPVGLLIARGLAGPRRDRRDSGRN